MSTDTKEQNFISESLRSDNSHSSIIRVFNKHSPVIVCEVILIRLRRYWRQLHLDVNIYRLFLALLILWGVKLIYFDDNYTPPTQQENQVERTANDTHRDFLYDRHRDFIALLGAGLGIFFTISNMHREYHYKKCDKASKYVEAWYGDSLIESVKAIRKITSEEFYDKYQEKFDTDLFNKAHSYALLLKDSVDGREELSCVQSNILKRLMLNKDEKKHISRILSFFEIMGQDVKLKVADTDYLKEFFYLIVINYYELFRKYIEYVQRRHCNRNIFCNFVYLAQTWEKEGDLPILPSICKRPLIVTHRDFLSKNDSKSGWQKFSFFKKIG